VVVQQTKSFQKERLSAAPKQQITKYTLSSPPPQRVTVHKIAQTDRALLHQQQKNNLYIHLRAIYCIHSIQQNVKKQNLNRDHIVTNFTMDPEHKAVPQRFFSVVFLASSFILWLIQKWQLGNQYTVNNITTCI